MAGSEIAQFREQQRLEEASALLGLFGPAAVAQHAAINARMKPHVDEVAKLFQEGRDDEAFELWESWPPFEA